MEPNEKLSASQLDTFQRIGARLKQLRIQKGYTNYENFAFENGLSRANYGKYENGKSMTVATLIKIVECHNLTLEEFFALPVNPD